MKKFLVVLFCALSIILAACSQSGTPGQDLTSMTVVALGDSITMGIQDAGLLRDFQLKNFPYLIATQMGTFASFQQPYVESPGIGVPPYKVPLRLQNGLIVQTVWSPAPTPDQMFNWIFPMLSNINLSQPYNNLGVNGARLYDMRNTRSYTDTTDSNYFFDVVLRNSTPFPNKNFGGKTSVQEALMLKPDIVFLWIGSNDILGTTLVGCGTNGNNFLFTSTTDFQAEYGRLLTDLKSSGGISLIVISKIPAYLPFVNALDGIYKNTQTGNSLSVFDPRTLAPINFNQSGGELYIPLLLTEANATHLLLTGVIACISPSGQGLPGSADLTAMGLDPSVIIPIMKAYGLAPNESGNGTPLTGDLTITQNEETSARGVIDSYNTILISMSASFGVPIVDIVQSWWGNGPETPVPFGGYSGAYALQAQDSTTFSLDGVHPSNLGNALTANAFIRVLNQKWQLGIPELNPDNYKGQYSGKSISSESMKSIERVKEMYQLKRR